MIEITLKNSRTSFRPGETIEGSAVWRLGAPLQKGELSLGWSTRGKGSVDQEIVETQAWETAPASGQRTFCFTAPTEPHSFDGHLISLDWWLELHLEPGTETARIEIIIAPTGRRIQIERIERASAPSPNLFPQR
jgi:hypothetical protein